MIRQLHTSLIFKYSSHFVQCLMLCLYVSFLIFQNDSVDYIQKKLSGEEIELMDDWSTNMLAEMDVEPYDACTFIYSPKVKTELKKINFDKHSITTIYSNPSFSSIQLEIHLPPPREI
jgi:hypothetical protein